MKNQIQTASEVKDSNLTSTLAHETRKNRQGLAMFVMTIANQSRAMKADTISKNRRSLKSHLSKGNFLIFVFSLISFCIIFAFSGCNKEKEDENGGKVKLLETITYEDGYYDKFEYDIQNRITKALGYREGEVFRTRTLTYNNVGDLVKSVSIYTDYPEEIREEVFIRDGNTIIYDSGTIILNNDGYPTKIILMYDNELVGERILKYQDGNVIKITSSDEDWEFKYDNKKSPIYYCKTPKWFLLDFIDFGIGLIHNVTKMSLIAGWGNSSTDLVYEYDNDGYPIKQTVIEKYYDGEEYTSVRTFTYK